MISFIEGTVREATLVSAVIDVGGIGYEVWVPVTTAEKLPPIGQKAHLHTVAIYREDAHLLFGFATREDREFFRLLVERVSGIGPKIAISILSKMSVPILRKAIADGDVALLAKCPGIGKKTAERLVIELRDKVMPAGSTSSETPVSGGTGTSVEVSPFSDAVSALVSLGYKPPDADKAVRRAQDKLGKDASAESLIRGALG